MGSSRQSASNQRPADAQAIGGVRVGVLGDVVSPRGVRLLATHGPAGELKTYLLPHMATFSYSIRSPNNVALTVDGRPFRTSGALGFCASGVPLQMRATGYFTYAICFLSSDFLDGLAETESGLRLGGIDLMYSIESERLTHLSRAAFARRRSSPGSLQCGIRRDNGDGDNAGACQILRLTPPRQRAAWPRLGALANAAAGRLYPRSFVGESDPS